MSLGWVDFVKDGKPLIATLNGAGEWECSDQAVARILAEECSMDDYTAAHGRPGVSHILRAAELLDGVPQLKEKGGNDARPNDPSAG